MVPSPDHDVRREHLANAAMRVMSREGIDGLSMRAAAKEAGCTTGCLTHYYDSKESLFIDAVHLTGRRILERIEAAEQARPGLDALRRVALCALPLTAETRNSWRIWVGCWDRAPHDPALAQLVRRYSADWRNRLVRLVALAQADGDIPTRVDPEVAAESIALLVDGIGARALRERVSKLRQTTLLDRWMEAIRLLG